jgi:hypothetical protein
MTKGFEEWAKDMNYNLNKEPYKSETFGSAWVYTNTHTQSAWQGWEAALIFCGFDEGEME